jgi:hypothetical protein
VFCNVTTENLVDIYGQHGVVSYKALIIKVARSCVINQEGNLMQEMWCIWLYRAQPYKSQVRVLA